jgi:hypothetical protein
MHHSFEVQLLADDEYPFWMIYAQQKEMSIRWQWRDVVPKEHMHNLNRKYGKPN